MADVTYNLTLGSAGMHRRGRIIVTGSDGSLRNYNVPARVLDFLEHEVNVNSLRPGQVTIDKLLERLPIDGSTKNVKFFKEEAEKIFTKYELLAGTRA